MTTNPSNLAIKDDGNLANHGKSAKPFLKWAGGKRKLCADLYSLAPESFGRYFEPMVGGGAFFFYLNPTKSTLSDSNPELVNVYNVVKNNPKQLIEELRGHHYSEEYFYSIREADREKDYKNWSSLKKASRFIFLNKTCYNGLYRVNKNGYFNVPFGKYQNPDFVNAETILQASSALQSSDIICDKFEGIESRAREGDFVYFDPPYLPISKTSSFTSYTKDDFLINEQVKLRDTFNSLNKKGVYVMMSNSDNEFITSLYEGYKINRIFANRAINSDSSKRGKILEIVVTNY